MFQITQTIYGNGAALIWLLMGFDAHLVEKLGTTPKQNLTESSFFEISTSNLEHKLLQIFGFHFLAVLE